MRRLNIRRFGLAFGATLTVLYLGCVMVMTSVDRTTTVLFFNSLMHGVDIDSVLRSHVPSWEVMMGILETFVLGWFLGATVASFYNFGIVEATDSSGLNLLESKEGL